MFSAGSNLKDKADEEIFYQDFKRFTSGKVAFAVGQITSLDGGELEALKPVSYTHLDVYKRQWKCSCYHRVFVGLWLK